MPDPTMVAVLGAGEVPAYTGIAYIVLKDDETREGEVSQYEFVVATCGDRREVSSLQGRILVTGSTKTTSAPMLAIAYVDDGMEVLGISQAIAASVSGQP